MPSTPTPDRAEGKPIRSIQGHPLGKEWPGGKLDRIIAACDSDADLAKLPAVRDFIRSEAEAAKNAYEEYIDIVDRDWAAQVAADESSRDALLEREESREAMVAAVGEAIVGAIKEIPRNSGCPVCGAAWTQRSMTSDDQVTGATCANRHRWEIASDA